MNRKRIATFIVAGALAATATGVAVGAVTNDDRKEREAAAHRPRGTILRGASGRVRN